MEFQSDTSIPTDRGAACWPSHLQRKCSTWSEKAAARHARLASILPHISRPFSVCGMSAPAARPRGRKTGNVLPGARLTLARALFTAWGWFNHAGSRCVCKRHVAEQYAQKPPTHTYVCDETTHLCNVVCGNLGHKFHVAHVSPINYVYC